MTYGYARISTKKQSIERQIRNITDFDKDAHIIQEVYTGTKMTRPEWKKLKTKLQSGDTVIFDSVSRMSRDAVDGFNTYKELYTKGITLIFLKERHIDTDAYKDAMQGIVNINVETGEEATDDLINGIMAAVNKFMFRKLESDIQKAFEQAEKEVKDLQQRTKEGLITAKLNGKRVGTQTGDKLITKKSIAAKEQIKKYSRDFDGTLSDADTIKLIGIARNSYYKYKAELKAEME